MADKPSQSLAGAAVAVVVVVLGVFAARQSGGQQPAGHASMAVTDAAAASSPPVPSRPPEAKKPQDMTDAELAGSINASSHEWDDLDRQLSLVRRPEFIVSGEVRDRDETSVTVWGVAIPTNPRDQNDLGTHLTETNLAISPYEAEGLVGGQFYRGSHCFIGRATGKNRFGASVPVYVYGPQPPDAVALIKKLRDVDALNNAERAERDRRQAEAKKAQMVRDAPARLAAGSPTSVSSPPSSASRDVTPVKSPTAAVPRQENATPDAQPVADHASRPSPARTSLLDANDAEPPARGPAPLPSSPAVIAPSPPAVAPSATLAAPAAVPARKQSPRLAKMTVDELHAEASRLSKASALARDNIAHPDREGVVAGDEQQRLHEIDSKLSEVNAEIASRTAAPKESP